MLFRSVMVYARFVEIGRVVYVRYGKEEGKLGVIIEVVDHNKVQVAGPTTGLRRQVLPLNWLTLTNIKLTIGRGSRTKALTKAVTTQKLDESWQKTGLYKRLASQRVRKNMTDFDRFKLKIAQHNKTQVVGKAFRVLKKEANKAAAQKK